MLDLAGDLERAPPEIDITHLDCSGLAQTQPSEGTQSQECAEGMEGRGNKALAAIVIGAVAFLLGAGFWVLT
jgi:hypothetical protein